jgi:D-alanyl-D-alanine carboxypeptidase
LASNTNISATETAGLIASKTGFTDLAGGNLAVAINHDLNHPFAIVVLGSTREARFTDVAMLQIALQEYLAAN